MERSWLACFRSPIRRQRHVPGSLREGCDSDSDEVATKGDSSRVQRTHPPAHGAPIQVHQAATATSPLPLPPGRQGRHAVFLGVGMEVGGAEGWWLGGPEGEQSACPSGQPVPYPGRCSHQHLFWKLAWGQARLSCRSCRVPLWAGPQPCPLRWHGPGGGPRCPGEWARALTARWSTVSLAKHPFLSSLLGGQHGDVSPRLPWCPGSP